jgi:hypothetical protein
MMPFHYLKHGQGGIQIVPVVFDRLGDRSPTALYPAKWITASMDFSEKKPVERVTVGHVNFDKTAALCP